MPNTPWAIIFNQLIADLRLLIDIYSLPSPTREELWPYEWTSENVQGALMRLPTCPQFDYLAVPEKTHGEFLEHWRILEELSDSWEQRVDFGRDQWPEDRIVVERVLKGIEGARPVGVMGKRYEGQEAHIAGR